MADLIDFDPSKTWQEFEAFDGLSTPNLNLYGNDDGLACVSSLPDLAGSSIASFMEPDFSSLLSARPAEPAQIFSASGTGRGRALAEAVPPADAIPAGLRGGLPREMAQRDFALPDSLQTLAETPLPSSLATSESSLANSRGGLRTTITLENVQPGTLIAVMDLLIQSRAKLKLETQP
jgi:hypothetical protein